MIEKILINESSVIGTPLYVYVKPRFDDSASIYDYTELLAKSKPYVFGKLRENFIRVGGKSAESRKFLKFFQKKPLSNRENRYIVLQHERENQEKEGRIH